MDGSVARQRGESGRSGAFLDSVLDRVSDMILFACLFWRLAATGQRLDAVLALDHAGGEPGGQPRPRRGRGGRRELSEGLFQRLERVIALVVGLLIPGAMTPVLVLLALLGVVTVAQRYSPRCERRDAGVRPGRQPSRRSPRASCGPTTCRPDVLPVAHDEQRLFAVADHCTGSGCSLAEGSFDDRSERDHLRRVRQRVRRRDRRAGRRAGAGPAARVRGARGRRVGRALGLPGHLARARGFPVRSGPPAEGGPR